MDSFLRDDSPVQEKFLLGTIGAIIGSIPGFLLWLLLSKIGFIAGISGVVLIFGALLGYKFLGKDVGKIGFIICIAVTVLMIYFATKISWCIEIHSACKDFMTFKECYSDFSEMLKLADCTGKFIFDLLVGYALAAASIISKLAKKAR